LYTSNKYSSRNSRLVIFSRNDPVRDSSTFVTLCWSLRLRAFVEDIFTVLVHGIEAIAAKLKEGHRFFSSLLQRGEVLFDSQAFSLTVPRSIPLAVSNIEAYWTKRHDLANHFFQGATHALSEGWNDQAVFMLHQAVEHACTALIKVYLGYRASSHKLSMLLSMLENFSLHSITVFPRITPEEIRLFTVLEKGYSHSQVRRKVFRFNRTVDALRMEVEEFLQIARALFNKKVQAENSCTEKRDVSTFESIGLDTFARVILRHGERECVEVESKYRSCESILVRNDDKRLWVTTTNVQTERVYDATSTSRLRNYPELWCTMQKVVFANTRLRVNG
jgi:HEPN domain-containing protein